MKRTSRPRNDAAGLDRTQPCQRARDKRPFSRQTLRAEILAARGAGPERARELLGKALKLVER